MGMRLSVAVCAGKAASRLLHALGRGGTTLPGRVVRRLCPDALRLLAEGGEVVCVTGTNGKTTTTHMLVRMLEAAGHRVLTNAAGANMETGITAAFACGADVAGRPTWDVAVVECDEASLRRVAAALVPKVILVTNVFRDQLDRYGEVTTTLGVIREGILQAPASTLCLNADDPLTATLADCGNATVFFGEGPACGEGEAAAEAPEVAEAAKATAASADTTAEALSVVPVPREATHCLRCGGELDYRYRTFAHLGGYTCPACGFARPEARVQAERMAVGADGTEMAVSLPDRTVRVDVDLPGAFNAYNALSALAAAHVLGVPMEEAAGALAIVDSAFGRMETFSVEGTPVRIILTKNPTGMDQALAYLLTCWGPDGVAPGTIIFGLNDKSADGEDISWIWDADFERFFAQAAVRAEGAMPRLGVYGTRRHELALRMKYAGCPVEGTDLGTTEDLIAFTREGAGTCLMLLNYTAMFEVRDTLQKRYGLKDMYR